MARAFVIAVIMAAVPAVAQECPRWDREIGTEGIQQSGVFALTVHDDGRGPALFAGGEFNQADGHSCRGVARWDGSAWSPLGIGVDGVINAMAQYNGDLIVAGNFTIAGDQLALNIARWHGFTWSALGQPGDGLGGGGVRSLAVLDGVLYAGGEINTAAGVTVHRLAKWDGKAWSDAGEHCSIFHAMTVFQGQLYIHGAQQDRPVGIYRIAGGKWELVAEQPFDTNAMTEWNPGDGPRLYLATEDGFFCWNGQGVEQLTPDNFANSMKAVVVYNDGSGSALYAGGQFGYWDDGPLLEQVARWDGKQWSSVGGGVASGTVAALASGDIGRGAALFVGGDFTVAGGCHHPGFNSRHIAEWGCRGGCYGDFDEDGGLSLFDFLAFVNAFNGDDGAADCNQDCAFDLFDFLCFTNAFNAGC